LIQLLTNQQIDKKKWDECLHACPQNNLYANSWYLDLVCPNWKGIVYEQNQKYSAIMPVPVIEKYFFEIVRQPLFCQQVGFFSQNEALLDDFLQVLSQKFRYIPKYCLNVKNFSEKIALPFQTQKNYTHHLDLSQNYEQIYKGYHADRRYRLRKATASEIIESLDIESLIQLFREDTAKKISGGVSEKAYSLLRTIFSELTKRNLAKLFYTKKNGQITSGILVVFYQNQLIYLFNAAPEKFRKDDGRTLLLDHIFRKYAQSDFIFDFESPKKPQICSFYESFGAKPMPFWEISYNNLPFWLEKIRQWKKQLL